MKNGGLNLLKKSLESANVYFGKDEGTRESEFLKEFSNQILADNGGSWHSPPYKLKLNLYQRQLRDLFISSFDDKECWGFKNDNTILIMNLWQAGLSNATPIGIFRHPNQLVTIYKSKYNFPVKLTYKLWVYYNRKMLSMYEEKPFPIIELENRRSRYNRAVVNAFKELGLENQPKNIQLPRGSRAQLERREMTKDVARLYRRLRQIKVKVITEE